MSITSTQTLVYKHHSPIQEIGSRSKAGNARWALNNLCFLESKKMLKIWGLSNEYRRDFWSRYVGWIHSSLFLPLSTTINLVSITTVNQRIILKS